MLLMFVLFIPLLDGYSDMTQKDGISIFDLKDAKNELKRLL